MRYLLILLIILAAALPVSAQTDCGDGLPCGPIPWRLPSMPRLASPTPMPPITNSGNVGPGAPTAVPTAAAGQPNIAGVDAQIATLQSITAATPIVIDSSLITPVALGSEATTFVGYAMGLQGVHFGPFTPLVTFTFFALFTVLSTKIALFLLPLIAVIFGFIRKLIVAVLEFLPL